MTKFLKPKGTVDYYKDSQSKLDKVFKILKEVSKSFAYEQITLPTFEYLELFKRSVGEETDIVSKEMFTFSDKGDRELVLRPEGTASTVRMALENNLLVLNQKQRLFYIGSMYRYERPQKGRQREFFQFGVENFGDKNIETDAEIILFATRVLDKLNISKYELHINSIGNVASREKYKEVLRSYFKQHFDKLSDDSKRRLETNVLRILDSKDKNDIELAKHAPKILDYLDSDEKDKFEHLLSLLKKLNINYVLDHKLVRGLDYYNSFVFEFISTDEEKLGAQATLIGGGRYDSLVGNMTNKELEVSAIGFAAGIERLILASNIEDTVSNLEYYIVTSSKEYNDIALKVATKLRQAHSVQINFDDTKLSKKMEKANSAKALNAIIINDEAKENIITIRNLKTGEEKKEKI